MTRGDVLVTALARDRGGSAQYGVPEPGRRREMAGLTAEAGLEAAPAGRHRGCAFGDLDGDGRVDVVTTALGADAEIWMNRSPASGHWLDIALEGTRATATALAPGSSWLPRRGDAIQSHDHLRGVRLLQPWPGALRAGCGQEGGSARNSLAVRHRPDAAGHTRRSGSQGEGAGGGSPFRSRCRCCSVSRSTMPRSRAPSSGRFTR